MSLQNSKRCILIIDDSVANVTILDNILGSDYQIKFALSGTKAIQIIANDDPPDLILLDIMMPGLSGYEVCSQIKKNPRTQHIPIIFVTSKDEINEETMGFKLGAVDYITKPVNPAIVRARVKTHLELYDHNQLLEKLVTKRTDELLHTQDVTIHGLAILAEFRDPETGSHLKRTQRYIRALATKLMNDHHFPEQLNHTNINNLFKSAPLHDIGKVGIPDKILLKPDKLTPEEFEVIKKHSLMGYQAITRAESSLGDTDASFLRYAREIAYTHHEKWDGSGYPQGLSGTQIPLSGRLMAVADVYDAFISKRIYKPGYSHETAVEYLIEKSGTQFDPLLIEAFFAIEQYFAEIAKTHSD